VTPPAVVSHLSQRVRNGIALLFALGLTHVTLSLQALPVVGLAAIAYLFFPPLACVDAWDATTRAPLFALMACGSGAMLAAVAWSAAWVRAARLPRPLRWTLVASLSLWALVASGEAVRIALMHTQLTDSTPACHRTWSLTASLDQRYGWGSDMRHPHAWRVRGDTVSLWSYRTLRFEPAPGWYGAGDAIAQCRGGIVRP
jgi:hypothetical protein